MLVACRLAGLSALEAHYAGVNAEAQSGPTQRSRRPSAVSAMRVAGGSSKGILGPSVARARNAGTAGTGSRREPSPSAFLRQGATAARPRRLRVRYERAGRSPLIGRRSGRRQDDARSDRQGAGLLRPPFDGNGGDVNLR